MTRVELSVLFTCLVATAYTTLAQSLPGEAWREFRLAALASLERPHGRLKSRNKPMSIVTNQSLCPRCYVRCPKDMFGRCTHCGAKRLPNQSTSPPNAPAPSSGILQTDQSEPPSRRRLRVLAPREQSRGFLPPMLDEAQRPRSGLSGVELYRAVCAPYACEHQSLGSRFRIESFLRRHSHVAREQLRLAGATLPLPAGERYGHSMFLGRFQ
jgi:hypothetical protein